METHTNPNALTQNELSAQIRELEKLAEEGKLTSIAANRLRELKIAKRNIQDALRTNVV